MDYAQLVKGCRRRDAKAQRALYDEMAPMVTGVCMRFASDRDEAQDMVQDVFVKVFERIGSLKEGDNLGAWVYRIVMNTCLDRLRRRGRTVSMEESGIEVPAVETDPFTMEEVVKAVQQLPPLMRAVFNLCDVEGYTLDEAAQRLKSNNQAVRVALHRARGRLKELLEGFRK